MPSTPVQIAIARQSVALFNTLMANPATAAVLLKALRAIRGNPGSGGPFYSPLAGSSSAAMRKEFVVLPGDKKLLWLLWNPAMNPIEVSLTMR